MDGVGSTSGGVLVLGATNVPWELDPAMRRRFEKRVYIALPEPFARTQMFKLNLGDTANDITADEFQYMGACAEGYSGSDIAVVVREALMEPLRKCQQAKQFLADADGNLHPCVEFPNCAYCPMQLAVPLPSDPSYIPCSSTTTTTSSSGNSSNDNKQCKYCHAIRMSLYDVPSEKLVVPVICFADFEKALSRAHSSVGADELSRFVSWTEEFGQDG